jgi:cytoskeletal protein CcmA (bactofilin family)
MVQRISIGLMLAAALAGAPAPAGAQEAEAGAVVTIPSGEVREGDLYTAGESVRIDGRLAGDLVAAAQRLLVNGQIDGDLFAVGRTIDLRGPVGDSTRIVGDQLTVNATIDGDLIAGGNRLRLLEAAVIRGGVVAAASSVEIEGTVEKNLRVAAGEIVVRGTVSGDANLIADRLELAPGARIDGDLDYRARIPLSPEAAARVAGTVRYEEAVDGDDEDDDSALGSVLFWSWQTGAALLAGLLAVALFRRVVQELVTAIAGATTLGALLGFGAFLIVPVSAVVAMATLVGLPIGLIAMLLFGVALYVAKLPIAVWAGGRLLALAGRPDASSYAAMAVGILVLYLLFAIPWIGWLMWLAAAWLGFGAMVLAGRRYLQIPVGDG